MRYSENPVAIRNYEAIKKARSLLTELEFELMDEVPVPGRIELLRTSINEKLRNIVHP